ncbi:MAG: hypothetical protein LBQ54_09310 [Planctomycetaceae bacterium]|jgi:hypothetical protein|nr:hypothetical protein [Planctomycetaceae bacterium]
MVVHDNLSTQKVTSELQCSPMSVQHRVEQYRREVENDSSHPVILPELPENYQFVPSQKQKSHTAFLPVQVVDPSVTHPVSRSYEIVTPNGLTLRLPSDTTLDLLAEVLSRLGFHSC